MRVHVPLRPVLLLAGIHVWLCGCAIQALRDDYSPPATARNQPGLPVLNVQNFYVTSTGSAVLQESHRQALRQSLAQCLANTGAFSKVDLEGISSPGNDLTADLFLTLDRKFNWWISWPAIYPMVGYWPIQAYTAKGEARLRVEGEVAGRPMRFDSRRKVEDEQYLYGFYVHAPAERRISDAYDQLFLELRDSVSRAVRSTPRDQAVPAASATGTGRSVRNIAVWDLDPNGVDSVTARVVADQITSNLLQRGRFTVLERRRMSDILSEQGFQQSGACDNQGCLVQVGKLLGVDAIVAGTVSKVADLYIANVRLIDIQSGRILISSQASSSQGFQRFLSVDLKTITDQF